MSWDVLVTLTLAVGSVAAVVLFVRGCRRPPREVWARSLMLGGGLASLVVALSPPVDAVADASFAAHMLQHLVLIVIAPPLLVMADPIASIMAGLRAGARHPVASLHRSARSAGLRSVPPVVAFLAHMSAVVVWHAPPLFDAAVESRPIHALEHTCFFVTALLFWAPVLTARGRRRLGDPAALAYLTLAGLVGTALGALLTFSSAPWYDVYVAQEGPAAALHDQQLAGVIMWIPPGVVYLAAAGFVFWRWIEHAEAGDEREAKARALAVADGSAPGGRMR